MRRLTKSGDASKIKPEWVEKIKRILGALNVATAPQELGIPGFGFHELSGPRKGTYSVLVSRNWRVTFLWDDDGPYDVNLEDYHGR